MRHNGERRPEEIEAEIARTRADMDATLNAIEHRLTPGQLVDQGLDYLRHSGTPEFMSNLGDSVKQNPLPVSLVGLGVAWLMMAGRWPQAPSPREETAGAMERVSTAATTATEKIGSTARAARDTVTQAASAARERASQMSAATQRQYERARGAYNQVLEEQPLALGAVGLAIGALMAAMMPRTRVEERMQEELTESGLATGSAPRARGATHASGDTIAEAMGRRAASTSSSTVSGTAACPATDAPASGPISSTSRGMDV